MTSKAEAALEAIRKEIIISDSTGETVVYETELASRFGMSRTPIRQILQRLAYEKLVFTKSGVGTVVTPLNDAERARDLCTFKGMTDAVLLHDLPGPSRAQSSDITALADLSSAITANDRELLYDLLSRLEALLVVFIGDPILRDAFSASFWRAGRWLVRDLAGAPDESIRRISMLVPSSKDQPPISCEALFVHVGRVISQD